MAVAKAGGNAIAGFDSRRGIATTHAKRSPRRPPNALARRLPDGETVPGNRAAPTRRDPPRRIHKVRVQMVGLAVPCQPIRPAGGETRELVSRVPALTVPISATGEASGLGEVLE